MANYPRSSVDRFCKYKSRAGGRPLPRRWQLFWSTPQSYQVLSRIAPFRPLLKGGGLPGSTESLCLLLGPIWSWILLGWIEDTPGELLSLIPICLDTESCVLSSSRCYQEKPWSHQGFFEGIPWTLARLSAQLHCDVVCVRAIVG